MNSGGSARSNISDGLVKMPQARRANREEWAYFAYAAVSLPVLDTGKDEAQCSIRPFYSSVEQ